MAEITRVSTQFFYQGNIAEMSRLQSDLGKLNRQISSGNKVDSFLDLSALGQTERVLGFESQLNKTDDYIRSNTIVSNRVESYNDALSNLIEIAEELRNIIVLRRTPTTGEVLPLNEIVNSQLAGVESNLNLQLEGRFLFSGSKTNIAAVGDISAPNFTVNGAGERVFNTNYYQGDNVKQSTKASDALSLEYGVTANDPAFQNLISALHLTLAGDAADDDTTLIAASDLVTQAISDLSSVQANINNNITILDKTNVEHQDFKLFLDRSINDVTETDVGEATIQLSTIQTTLQASFLAFSRISSLKLSDFLR